MEDPHDYWVRTASAVPAGDDFLLNVQTIAGVAPLDPQFGVEKPKTVPEALLDPLFGQEEGAAPLSTYMILDAAKVPQLPALLEASELEHRCLFKGEAFEELKDVAPWIVRLEIDAAFTRNLFTRSDLHWHRWGTAPGIYIRSIAPLGEMWSHFRKFTRIQDESGKWYYWRFWEGRFLLPMLNAALPAERRKFFCDGTVHSVLVLTADENPELTVIRPAQPS